MNLRERQELIVSDFESLEDWVNRFTYLIELGGQLPSNVDESRFNDFRISTCKSRTYFRATIEDGKIHISGWSNAEFMAGLIVLLIRIFDGIPVKELTECPVFFHEKTGLINNLTTLRKEGLMYMIESVNVLLKQKDTW